MPRIEILTRIRAPIEICFDLARDIDFHLKSTANSKERAIAGKMSGLIGAGEEVTFEATHLGLRQRLTSRISIFSPPNHFRDSQVRGAFTRFDHDHIFVQVGEWTEMRDIFDFDTPYAVIGKLVNVLFLTSYMKRFLETRAQALKEAAESRV